LTIFPVEDLVTDHVELFFVEAMRLEDLVDRSVQSSAEGKKRDGKLVLPLDVPWCISDPKVRKIGESDVSRTLSSP